MLFSIFALSLVGLAAASPTAQPESRATKYPAFQYQRGFKLYVSVSEAARPDGPKLKNQWVVGYHVGAALNIPVAADKSVADTYYVNTTAHGLKDKTGSLLHNIGGDPPFPQALLFTPHKKPNYLKLEDGLFVPGIGTKGVQLTQPTNPVSYLDGAFYYACKSKLAYYGGKEFVTINRTTLANPVGASVPEGCASVTLIPECAKFGPETTEPSIYPTESRCYKDAASINWNKYV